MNAIDPDIRSDAFRELGARTQFLRLFGMATTAGIGVLSLIDRATLEKVAPEEVIESDILGPDVIHAQHGNFFRLIYEVLVTRSVEDFELYLATMLRRVFTEVPNSLRSKNTATYEQILEFEKRDDFVKWAADRQVHELGYKGLAGIVEHFKQKNWAKLDIDTDSGRRATEYIEVRNIIAHNGGKVSDIFLYRTKRQDLKAGDVFPLDIEYIGKGAFALAEVALAFDQSILSHFDLPPSPPKANS